MTQSEKLETAAAKPHAVRTWRAVAGKNAGKLGDKRKAYQQPEDVCLICLERRDHANHR